MKIVEGVVVVGAIGLAAWATAPWVSMGRCGTVDGRTLDACRSEDAIPAPRHAPDNEPSSSRTG